MYPDPTAVEDRARYFNRPWWSAITKPPGGAMSDDGKIVDLFPLADPMAPRAPSPNVPILRFSPQFSLLEIAEICRLNGWRLVRCRDGVIDIRKTLG